MKIKWKHLSSKEKDELIGLAVKALVELSKGGPHAIPMAKSERYYVEETAHMDLCWAVADGHRGDEGESVCFCTSWEDADRIRDALNSQQ